VTGVLAKRVGVGQSSNLQVTANNVTRVEGGFAASGLVTTTQTPNTLVTGGQEPYSYSWEMTEGDNDFEISAALVANPGWSAVVSEEVQETWTLTVTDAASAEATMSIVVTLVWNNFS